jgi:hypothetical protein
MSKYGQKSCKKAADTDPGWSNPLYPTGNCPASCYLGRFRIFPWVNNRCQTRNFPAQHVRAQNPPLILFLCSL